MIKHGKTIKVLIRGHTLNQSLGKIVVQKSFIELPSVPIGMLYPVELPISLSNIGEVPLKYELNYDLFKAENPILVAQKIVEFGNEKGVLAALKEGSFFVYFRPNKVGCYSFNIQLIVFNYFKEIQRIDILMKGTSMAGLNNQRLLKFFKNDDVLMKERIQAESDEDTVYVSDDIIDFRNLTQGVSSKKIIFLMNYSKKHTFAFNFLLFQMSKLSKKHMRVGRSTSQWNNSTQTVHFAGSHNYPAQVPVFSGK